MLSDTRIPAQASALSDREIKTKPFVGSSAGGDLSPENSASFE
jgi:hypothetical protein